MEDVFVNNCVELCGRVAERPSFSHKSRDVEYLSFPIVTERLSGVEDTVNVVVRSDASLVGELHTDSEVTVKGELRSFNNKSGIGAKLVITVYARELSFGGEYNRNVVRLRGTLCQPPNFRKTPMGREICDLMLAVNRRYGRADYLPCIAWGSNARRMSELNVGARLEAEGRIQSRSYIKLTESGAVEKTAFEVSLSYAELLE